MTALRALLCLLAVILARLSGGEAVRFKANVVEAPSNYGYQQQMSHAGGSQLKLKRDPAPFFGSASIQTLTRKCLTLDKNGYEWRLCPFHNATQTETGTNRWNPYSGVLGIWAGWTVDIVNNTLLSMSMTDGDDCGSHGPRQVEVKPVCGSKETLRTVEEPSTCHYLMTLEAPAFCQHTNLLVYPLLETRFRTAWDEAYTEWQDDILTTKGYIRAVSSLLTEAGVLRITASPHSLAIKSDAPSSTASLANLADPVDPVDKDNYEVKYADLMEKFERLGRQHAETIVELGNCQRELRQSAGRN